MNDRGGLEVHIDRREGVTIVQPVGDVDLSQSPVLRSELHGVHAEKPKRLIVDLRDVPYMDSSGVATLVEAMRDARKSRTELVLCCMQERVRSIFEIARLDAVFTIVDDLDAAMTV
ncbi:MAG: STAS domain-containing protein [Phycisphaerales bacterium]|nr:STAS domain-containing protein [Phycisphaerales bacterium]